MNPQEIREMIEGMLRDGIGLTLPSYLFAAVACAVGAWLGGFLATKGKNEAILQDVGRITKEVESIKNLFRVELAKRTHLSSVSLVAAERRLDALQGAYRLTYLLSEVGTHDEEESARILGEMRAWYLDNAVYIPSEVRNLFFKALYAPHGRFAALEAARHARSKEEKAQEIAKATEEGRVLRDVPNQILQLLQIPPFDLKASGSAPEDGGDGRSQEGTVDL